MQQIFSPSLSNGSALQFNLLHSSNLHFVDSASTSSALYSNSIVSSCLNSGFTSNNLIVKQDLSKQFNFNLSTPFVSSSTNIENNFIQTSNFAPLPPPDNCNFTPQQTCNDYSIENETSSLQLIINSQNDNFASSNFGHDRRSTTNSFNPIKQNDELLLFNSQNVHLNNKKLNDNSETNMVLFNDTKKLLNFSHINETNCQNNYNSNNCLTSNLKIDPSINFLNQTNAPVNQQITQIDCKFFYYFFNLIYLIIIKKKKINFN